jgi:hypothetical protein
MTKLSGRPTWPRRGQTGPRHSRLRSNVLLGIMPVPDALCAILALGALALVNITPVCAIDEAADKTLQAIRELEMIGALNPKRPVTPLPIAIGEADLGRLSLTSPKFR